MSVFWCPTCDREVPESEVEYDEGDTMRSSDNPSDGIAAGYSHWPEQAAFPHVVVKGVEAVLSERPAVNETDGSQT